MFRKLRAMLDQRRQRESLYSSAAYWDSKALQFDRHAVSMWPNNNLNALYHQEIIDLLNSWLSCESYTTTPCLLDVGCGTGRLSRWFSARGLRVIGIDFSAGSLAIARSEGTDSNLEYRAMSMFDLTDSETYDLMFSWGSITFACRNSDDLRRLMKVLFRALKPGGRALLLEPVHKGFLHRVLRMGLPEFIGIMREVGFRVEDVKSMHFWPSRVALAFVSLPEWITSPVYSIGQLLMRLPGLHELADYRALSVIRPTDSP